MSEVMAIAELPEDLWISAADFHLANFAARLIASRFSSLSAISIWIAASHIRRRFETLVRSESRDNAAPAERIQIRTTKRCSAPVPLDQHVTHSTPSTTS